MHLKPNEPLQQIHACMHYTNTTATFRNTATDPLQTYSSSYTASYITPLPSSHPSTNPSKPSAEPPSLPLPSADPSASSETLPLVHHKPPTYTPGGHIPGLCPSSKAALLGCVVTRISTAWQRR
ncbi:hypothetical protein HBI56_082110 [Parastagonospora nodorum]|nr:hypothetical protein HBH53_059950 [Parastagonospora nodorum]KAH3975526.1 hypothetical protein HBH52_126900 [Parastagonospora nodorum]KAH3978972.1 hypothetical protein HBH51_063820 [Parastagonospora nodorum]KAH3999037.1 hypothetical protein HBI10_120460 [Parastagonospora nodorum]KAH4025044.1 hypothetical protein HBI13_076730 [Parastagonospora nodorum]